MFYGLVVPKAILATWKQSPLVIRRLNPPLFFGLPKKSTFLTRNGLNATFRKYDTGVGSLDGMLNGETDITVGTTEFPLVGRALQKARIHTLGSIDKSELVYLVGRKDRGN